MEVMVDGGAIVVAVVVGDGAVIVVLDVIDVEVVAVAGAGDTGIAARWRLPGGVRGAVVDVAAPAAAT